MIGMNQIKKRLIHGILIGLGVGIVGIIVVLIVTNNIVKGYKQGTNTEFLSENTSMVTTFNRDVIQGEEITSDMLQEQRVHNSLIPAEVYSLGNLVGQRVKYNVPRNVAIIPAMIADNIVGADVRIQEINAIVLPSDLTVGDYVDIRLMMPSGVEYIVLAQKQIDDIIGSTIKMDMSEEDILTLNAAIVDSYLINGSKLYAVKYTDPTTQIKVDDKAMQDAKTYIAEKLAAELIKEGAIAQNTTETVDKIVETVVNGVIAATDDGTTLVPATDASETVEVPADKYIFRISTLTADELVELISKYAIEYRYYIESYNKIETNYQPNSEVRKYMEAYDDKVITEQAKAKLSAEIRRGMEASILNFELQSGDGYNDIVSSLESSINIQKSLRSAALDGQQ